MPLLSVDDPSGLLNRHPVHRARRAPCGPGHHLGPPRRRPAGPRAVLVRVRPRLQGHRLDVRGLPAVRDAPGVV